MNVLVLGGQSPKHYDWVREVGAALERHDHSWTTVDYENWAANEPRSDFDLELDRVAAAAQHIEPFVVVAKSIGTLLTAVNVAHGAIDPLGTVLLGFPLHDAADVDDLPAAIASLPRTIVVQNDEDPFGSADEITELFAEDGPADFGIETVHGNATHDYLDFEHIASLVDEIVLAHDDD